MTISSRKVLPDFIFLFFPLHCCCNGTICTGNWLLPFLQVRGRLFLCVCVLLQFLCDYFCLRCTFCWTSKLNTSLPCYLKFFFILGRFFCLACKVLSSFSAPSASRECKALMWREQVMPSEQQQN